MFLILIGFCYSYIQHINSIPKSTIVNDFVTIYKYFIEKYPKLKIIVFTDILYVDEIKNIDKETDTILRDLKSISIWINCINNNSINLLNTSLKTTCVFTDKILLYVTGHGHSESNIVKTPYNKLVDVIELINNVSTNITISCDILVVCDICYSKPNIFEYTWCPDDKTFVTKVKNVYICNDKSNTTQMCSSKIDIVCICSSSDRSICTESGSSFTSYFFNKNRSYSFQDIIKDYTLKTDIKPIIHSNTCSLNRLWDSF